MQFITLFMLAGCLSITNAMDPDVQNRLYQLEINIEKSVNEKCPIKLGSSGYVLTLLKKGSYQSGPLHIWNGKLNNGIEVDVRFIANEDHMNEEKAVYKALGAINNHEIEKHGIPQIFYCGKIFNAYAIVMSHFDEPLTLRCYSDRRKFNIYTILQVFLQLVETLSYLHTKEVVHNDITADSIFLRGENVFIKDFDMATIKGKKPSGLPQDHPMNAMDDLKSVVDSIWFIGNIPALFRMHRFERKTRQEKINDAENKCKLFEKYPPAEEVCLFICRDEALSGKQAPNYTEIIQRLKGALNYVKTKPHQKWIG